MDAQLEFRIRHFFRYFRVRLANARTLGHVVDATASSGDVVNLVPEQHVLLAAGIDALANYWSSAFRPQVKNHGERLGELLVTHADANFWGRVSSPDLVRRARAEMRTSWATVLRDLVGRHELDVRILDWRTDPTLAVLAADPRVVAAGIDVDWLRRSRYGEFVYREHRCCWLHEFNSSRRVGSEFPGEESIDPHYQNVSVGGPGVIAIEHRLTLPRSLLASTFERVIDSFEAECLAAGIDPAP